MLAGDIMKNTWAKFRMDVFPSNNVTKNLFTSRAFCPFGGKFLDCYVKKMTQQRSLFDFMGRWSSCKNFTPPIAKLQLLTEIDLWIARKIE